MVIKPGFKEWIGASNKIDLQKEWPDRRFINRNKSNKVLKG